MGQRKSQVTPATPSLLEPPLGIAGGCTHSIVAVAITHLLTRRADKNNMRSSWTNQQERENRLQHVDAGGSSNA